MNPLRPILELNHPGSYIVYNTLTKQSTLYDAGGSPRVGTPISAEDLLTLFEKSWITKYESRDGEHRYRLTEIGRAEGRR